MKNKFIALCMLGATTMLSQAADKTPELKDQKDKVSYSIGMDIGNNFKRNGIEINPDVLAAGLRDVLGSGKTAMTEQEAREVIMAFQQDLQSKRQEKANALGVTNKKEGADFLAANAKKEGVKTTPTGLQYKVLTAGKGPVPTSNDVVRAHYRGTLIDGTEFDSSYTRGQPFVTPVTQVIPGWVEALTKMKVGDKWQLFVPSELAYGERGAGGKIGPNAALIFEMELLGIEAPAVGEAKPPGAGAVK